MLLLNQPAVGPTEVRPRSATGGLTVYGNQFSPFYTVTEIPPVPQGWPPPSVVSRMRQTWLPCLQAATLSQGWSSPGGMRTLRTQETSRQATATPTTRRPSPRPRRKAPAGDSRPEDRRGRREDRSSPAEDRGRRLVRLDRRTRPPRLSPPPAARISMTPPPEARTKSLLDARRPPYIEGPRSPRVPLAPAGRPAAVSGRLVAASQPAPVRRPWPCQAACIRARAPRRRPRK